MILTDPIADMLTRIRNANMVRHKGVQIPASKIKIRLAEILKDEGFIENFEVVQEKNHSSINIELKYKDKDRAIKGLRRISKPGLRVYVNKDKLPKVLGGLGIAVISTSKGVVTDKVAKQLGVGGEVMCYVW